MLFCESGGSYNWSDVQMPVPTLPPSRLENSPLIEIDYKIVVIIFWSGAIQIICVIFRTFKITFFKTNCFQTVKFIRKKVSSSKTFYFQKHRIRAKKATIVYVTLRWHWPPPPYSVTYYLNAALTGKSTHDVLSLGRWTACSEARANWLGARFFKKNTNLLSSIIWYRLRLN